MRDIDTGNSDALSAAPDSGLVERALLTIHARNRSDNSITEFCFWGEPDNETISVISGIDGTTESRTYVGAGAILDIGDIANVADLTIQRVSVSLSQIHETVQDMFRTYDVHLAAAEIHKAVLDPATRTLVGDVYCHMVGQVDTAPLTTPIVQQEGALSLEIVSDTNEMTRVNPAKRGDPWQSQRSGDRMMQYASQIANGQVVLYWGQNTVGTPQ